MMMVIARQSHLRGQNLRFTFECNNPYLPTYLPTYLHTYIPTYLQTYLHTYLRSEKIIRQTYSNKKN